MNAPAKKVIPWSERRVYVPGIVSDTPEGELVMSASGRTYIRLKSGQLVRATVTPTGVDEHGAQKARIERARRRKR